MNKVLKNSWALFLGMGFIMMAYGFQGSLLGVRAVQEEFSLNLNRFHDVRILCRLFYGCRNDSKYHLKSRSHKSFCSFCLVSLFSYSCPLSSCKSIYLVFVKSLNRNKYGMYLYCCGELVKR